METVIYLTAAAFCYNLAMADTHRGTTSDLWVLVTVLSPVLYLAGRYYLNDKLESIKVCLLSPVLPQRQAWECPGMSPLSCPTSKTSLRLSRYVSSVRSYLKDELEIVQVCLLCPVLPQRRAWDCPGMSPLSCPTSKTSLRLSRYVSSVLSYLKDKLEIIQVCLLCPVLPQRQAWDCPEPVPLDLRRYLVRRCLIRRFVNT
jgi:hypothetical protein